MLINKMTSIFNNNNQSCKWNFSMIVYLTQMKICNKKYLNSKVWHSLNKKELFIYNQREMVLLNNISIQNNS